jgi:DNA-binding MarR family transcriptional regulator
LTPFSRRTSLGYQVNLLARLFEQALRRRIAVHGVVPGQFPALLALYEQDGRTQAELCQLVQIEQPTMANTLNRMQRDGLISRSPDPVDGRRSLVELTVRGRELEQALAEAADSVNAEASDGLSDLEVETLMTLLAKLAANLEAGSGRRGVLPQSDLCT